MKKRFSLYTLKYFKYLLFARRHIYYNTGHISYTITRTIVLWNINYNSCSIVTYTENYFRVGLCHLITKSTYTKYALIGTN